MRSPTPGSRSVKKKSTSKSKATAKHDSFPFIPDGGETGKLFRSIRWSRHPLGDPKAWPIALKTSLGILFGSRHPMFIFWAPELYCFYNDGYMPSFGNGKHPAAMGQKGQECWPEIWPIIYPQIEDVMERGKASWNVNQLIPFYRNGRLEDVYWTYGYSPIFEADGSIGGTMVVCTETTAEVEALKALKEGQDRLQNSEELLSSAIEAAKIGFYDWDMLSNWITYSDQMKRDWDIESESTLEEALSRIHPEDREETNRLINEAIEKKATFHTEYRIIRTDGSIIWVEVHGRIFLDEGNRPYRFFGTSINVTDSVVYRKKLEERESELRLALGARDEFLSIASHELKTPLTSLWLQTQITRRNIQKQRPDAYDPSRVNKLVAQTERSLERLSHLVDDMLDISRIASGKLSFTFERFDLRDVISEVNERFQPQAVAFKTSITFIESPPVEGFWDRFRLDQVITNLITNALKYGQGTPVTLSLEVIDGNFVKIRVRDEGPGIAVKNQERIFRRFERAINATSISGLGLGLHICREIVERHGGRIFVESQVDHGSEFIVELPIFDSTKTLPEKPFNVGTEHTRQQVERDSLTRRAETARERLFCLIENAPAFVCALTGPDHTFEMVNLYYQTLVGKDRRLVGRPIRDALPEIVHQGFVDLLNKVYSTGEVFVGHETQVFLNRKSDGVLAPAYVNFVYQPRRNSMGKVEGIDVFGFEVTEQVETRQKIEQNENYLRVEREKFSSIFYGSGSGMVLFQGPDLVYEMLNEKYQALIPGRKVLGKPLLEALPEIVSSPFPDMIRKVLMTGIPSITLEKKTPIFDPATGKTEIRYFDTSFTRINDPNGQPNYVIGNATDVTERVLTRLSLEENRKEISKTISELKTERDLRERFVATLTHDLRTPLTAARMSAQLIIRAHSKPGQMETLGARIIQNMDRADQMIQDLLEASRIKAGEKVRLNISLCHLNQLVVETIEELINIHGNRLVVIESEKIEGHWDGRAIRRIIENLVGNAVKYGDTEAPIKILISKFQNKVEISIQNEGNPIPQKDQEHLFEPYHRAEATSKGSQKGWGIGLTLVRGLTEALGGKVRVSSTENEGTKFTVCLPIDSRKR